MIEHTDAVDVITALPDVAEGTSYGNRCWKVRGSMFVWDRPFSKADLKRFGDDPVPTGPIMGVKVDGLDDKEAILSEGTDGVFTIAHFDGFAAVLIQLDTIAPDDARRLVVDAWLAAAPDDLTEAYLRDHPIS